MTQFSRSRQFQRSAAALATGLLLASQASSADTAPKNASPKTDAALTRALTDKAAAGWISVIAHLDGPLTDTRQKQLAALKADVTRRLPIIQAVTLQLPRRNLTHLAALPFVTHLSYNGLVRKCDEFTVGHTGADVAAAQ